MNIITIKMMENQEVKRGRPAKKVEETVNVETINVEAVAEGAIEVVETPKIEANQEKQVTVESNMVLIKFNRNVKDLVTGGTFTKGSAYNFYDKSRIEKILKNGWGTILE